MNNSKLSEIEVKLAKCLSFSKVGIAYCEEEATKSEEVLTLREAFELMVKTLEEIRVLIEAAKRI